MEDRSEKLKAVMAHEIKRTGPMPFSRYMEICLYYPELGYYSRGASPTGREGDFYTAPHVHSLFGATIAAWMQETARRLDLPSPRLLEVGPGNGQLMEDILDHWESTDLPMPPVELVEGGEQRRRQLRERFAGREVTVPEPTEPGHPGPWAGFIVANELLDAMPMRVVARTADGLQEITVAAEGGGFVEGSRPFSTDDPVLAEVMEGLPEGFRTEFSDGWRNWVETSHEKLSAGAVLILDYGEGAGGMAMPWRAGGSLRCFYRHAVDSDPFALPGEKDITANVNFDLVERYARRAGFSVEPLRTQSSFLVRNGILELLAASIEGSEDGAVSEDWLKVKNLIHDEDGMGSLFKVMVLTKET